MIGASAECVTPTTSCGQIVLLAHLNHNFLQHKIVPHVFSATVTYQSIYCRFHQLIERVRNLPRLGIPCLNQTFNININLLYIGSDNLPFLGAYLQNGCIAVIATRNDMLIPLPNANHSLEFAEIQNTSYCVSGLFL
jgi:hypothetical protein